MVMFVILLCLQEGEIEKRKTDNLGESRIEAEMKELRKENSELKQYILALQGEVYGARLAAKYLDKELAGRWELMTSQNLYFLSFFMTSYSVFEK